MGRSFAQDNERFLRGQGWGGTKYENDEKFKLTEKNQFLVNALKNAVGDDSHLTQAEQESIYSLQDRGPYGRFAYGESDVANALAEIAASGVKLDKNTMDRFDLAYSGDDILQRVKHESTGPNKRFYDSGAASYERYIDDGDDDGWNVYRWKGGSLAKDETPEEEVVETPETVAPVVEPPAQMQPSNELQNLREKYDSFSTQEPSSKYSRFSAGSIDYNTPYMSYSDQNESDRYQPSILDGKFSDYIFGDNKRAESKERAQGYKQQSQFL